MLLITTIRTLIERRWPSSVPSLRVGYAGIHGGDRCAGSRVRSSPSLLPGFDGGGSGPVLLPAGVRWGGATCIAKSAIGQSARLKNA